MKRTLLVFAATIAIGISLSALSQTNDPPAATDTNAPASLLSSPVVEFFENGSNWMFAAYGIYDTTTKDFGEGFGVGYEPSPYVVTSIRLDALNSGPHAGVWVPSGSLQLQVPVTFMGKLKVVPFTYAGLATSLNNLASSENGSPIGIFGAGAAVHFSTTPSGKWYVPEGLIGDWEKWTGGGFNDSQIRAGLFFKFW